MRSCESCRHTLGGGYCFGCNRSSGFHKWEAKPTTNADYIRSMTDEELARRIAAKTACMGCIFYEECNRRAWHKRCEDVWLDWLKSPAEEVSE